jgi:hypothetical protein
MLLAGCVLIVGVAPPAHADDDDTAYLSALQTVGVPANSPVTAPVYGRGLCDRLPRVGFDPLVTMVQHDMATGTTNHQAALVIGAGISTFCLDEVDLLPKTLTY